MSGAMTFSVALIGLAGVATAVSGVLLPGGRRLEVLLALVAGAGGGIAALAVGSSFVSESGQEASETLFLVATLLGASIVGVLLVVLWIRDAGRGT
jgi:hypothetical protein